MTDLKDMKILEYLEEHPKSTFQQVTEALFGNRNTCRKRLNMLLEKGMVREDLPEGVTKWRHGIPKFYSITEKGKKHLPPHLWQSILEKVRPYLPKIQYEYLERVGKEYFYLLKQRESILEQREFRFKPRRDPSKRMRETMAKFEKERHARIKAEEKYAKAEVRIRQLEAEPRKDIDAQ